MANTSVDILLRVRDEATAKLRQVATETGGIIGTMQRLSAGLGVWGALSAGISTAAAAAVAATSKMSDMVEQLGRASEITSVGIGPLQAMFKILREGGGDTESLTKALGRFKREIAENNPLLGKLGITSGSVEERFLKLADVLARSSDEVKVGKIAFDLLGKTGEQLVPHLSDLAAKTTQVEEAMKKSGEALTNKVIPKFQIFDDEMDHLRANWTGTWNEMVTASAGPSTTIVRMLDRLLGVFRKVSVYMLRTGFGMYPTPVDREPLEVPGIEVSASRLRDPLARVSVGSRSTRSKAAPIFGPGSPAGIEEWAREQLKVSEREVAEFLKRNIVLPAILGGGILPLPGGPGRIAGAQESPFKGILDEWNKAVGSITDSTQILRDSLDAVWTGLRQGISSVFVNMLNGSQTFAQAIRTVFRSLGESILSYLGELVAAKVFQLFLRLVGAALGIPIIPAVSTAVTGVGISGAALASPMPGAGGAATVAGAAARAGNTYIIQTISAKDVLQSLLSPTGAMRSANDRLVEVAAAS